MNYSLILPNGATLTMLPPGTAQGAETGEPCAIRPKHREGRSANRHHDLSSGGMGENMEPSEYDKNHYRRAKAKRNFAIRLRGENV